MGSKIRKPSNKWIKGEKIDGDGVHKRTMLECINEEWLWLRKSTRISAPMIENRNI